MSIYLGNTLLTGGGGGGGGGGSLLTGTSTYRALLIGGGGNGVIGANNNSAGGSAAGAFFDTILPFYSDTTYNIVVAAGGGTTSFETANGKLYADTGGIGARAADGFDGASGGGGGSANSNFKSGGVPYLCDGRGRQLAPVDQIYTVFASAGNPSTTFYTMDWMKSPGLQTLGFPGGYAQGTNSGAGGGGAGGSGANAGASVNASGGAGITSGIITTTTANSASVGDVDGGEVWFGAGGYGGRLTSVITTIPGTGPGTGNGGQSSNVSSGTSSGGSGCVILKVPTSTDFTQTGANTYTDQGLTAIIWTGTGTFRLNS